MTIINYTFDRNIIMYCKTKNKFYLIIKITRVCGYIIKTCVLVLGVISITNTYGSYTKEIVIRGIIDKDIGKNFIEALNNAKRNDQIYLYVKSCGGSIKEGVKIIDAMRNSAAQITVEIVDYAESLAAIIALFADQVYMSPDVIIMYHLPRTNNGKIAFLNSRNLNHRAMAEIVVNWILTKKNIMSEEQWSRFMKGGNIFITGDTFISRVEEATISPPIYGERYEPWRVIKCNPDYRYRSEE